MKLRLRLSVLFLLIASVAGAQGICPTGWHIATKTEWDTLTALATSMRPAETGKVLKEAGAIHWQSANGISGTDDLGFAALGAGQRGSTYYSGFSEFQQQGEFWTSTQYSTYTWMYYFLYNNDGYAYTQMPRSYGFSVRCVKD
jgi:uncharacterized protein (TIGR02145 family)